MNHCPDLLALVVPLRAREGGTLPATHGRLVHAAFFDLLNRFSTDLATQLHPNRGGNSLPFTLSSLRCRKKERHEQPRWERSRLPVIPIEVDMEYRLRITSLTKELSGVLLTIFQASPLDLNIGGINFESVSIETNINSRSTVESYANLAGNHPAQDNLYPHLLGCNFISATAIRSEKRNLLFPLPSLIFTQLIRRWNLFSPNINHLPYISGDAFDSSLMICGYNLHTHNLNFGTKGQQIGFTGYCEYRFSKIVTKEILAVCHLLGNYAFFAGIGYRTTWGMGQVRFVIP